MGRGAINVGRGAVVGCASIVYSSGVYCGCCGLWCIVGVVGYGVGWGVLLVLWAGVCCGLWCIVGVVGWGVLWAGVCCGLWCIVKLVDIVGLRVCCEGRTVLVLFVLGVP